MAAKKKSASDVVHDAEGRVDLEEQPMSIIEADTPDLGPAQLCGPPEPQPVIRSLQLHRRASITGIRGTADLLTVGEVIESIEAQMLGPVAGFVLIAKKAKPIFLPAASVLAVTVE